MSARRGIGMLLVPFIVALAACEDPPSNPSLVVVAYVGTDPIYQSDLERYFESNLGRVEPDEQLPPGTEDEVKSRLLDSMIDERMLYAEAERRSIEVSDLEVATYLDMGAAEPTDDPDQRAWRELEARQRLMIQKLQEQVVLDQPIPTDDEVESYAAAHRAELIPARPLELRALQLSSREDATRIARDIRSKRMTFNEAALAYEPSPGQALPQRVSWNTLSPEVRDALENLKPGQVSAPIELHDAVYLFQISSWLDDPADQDVELMHRALQALETDRRRQALDRLQQDLRAQVPVRLKENQLPFRYVPAS